MAYSNDLPPGVSFYMTSAAITAAIEFNHGDKDISRMSDDVEITLPRQLRPEVGFAGRSVRLAKLIRFLEEEGSPISHDRDMTLRHQARDEAMVEAGTLYDHKMYSDLPPQAREELETSYFSFETSYVMHLVADDVEEDDPDHAARLRYVADKYYPEREMDEPSEEELESVLGSLEEMVAEMGDRAPTDSDGRHPVTCRTARGSN